MRLCKFFLIILFVSCDSDTAFDSEFDKSFDTWQSSKLLKGNSYDFTITNSSVFGFSWETKITVKKGKIISREYKAYRFNQDTKENELLDTWFEGETSLNTNEEGEKAVTLDAIYDSCKNDILSVEENDNLITFLTENDGLISVCNYFPKNCSDDCSVGFNITSINWIE